MEITSALISLETTPRSLNYWTHPFVHSVVHSVVRFVVRFVVRLFSFFHLSSLVVSVGEFAAVVAVVVVAPVSG